MDYCWSISIHFVFFYFFKISWQFKRLISFIFYRHTENYFGLVYFGHWLFDSNLGPASRICVKGSTFLWKKNERKKHRYYSHFYTTNEFEIRDSRPDSHKKWRSLTEEKWRLAVAQKVFIFVAGLVILLTADLSLSLKIILSWAYTTGNRQQALPWPWTGQLFFCPHAPDYIWELNDTVFAWILASVTSIACPTTILLNWWAL